MSGASTSSVGVAGLSERSNGTAGQSTDGNGVYGVSIHGYGVYGQSDGVAAVRGDGGRGAGVLGTSSINSGVQGTSVSGSGVSGVSSGGSGMSGVSGGGSGVSGVSTSGGIGVFGESLQGQDGVMGISNDDGHSGTSGINNRGGSGIYGVSAFGLAGEFNGNVLVTGTLSTAAAAVTIDHPLDPANKTLSHALVESPDMMDLYTGTTITDAHGEATVTLPAYFQALNREFRYQLTVVEQFAQAIVARKIEDHQFTIKTDKPQVEVSWMVTGVRQDAYTNAHRIVVEDEKPAPARGAYLHPEVYGQPKEQGMHQARRMGATRPLNGETAPPPVVAQP